MVSPASCVLAACALCLARAQWQPDPSPPSAWQSYGPSPSQPQPQPQQFPYPAAGCGAGVGGGGELLPDLSSLKSGLLQTGASAVVAALIAKLPALIFLKVIVFKLVVVPMLFMFVAMPVLMPLLMMLMPMMMNMMNMGGGDMMSTSSTTTTTAAPASRTRRMLESGGGGQDGAADLEGALRAVLGSQRCLERVACTLGDRHRSSPYRKPVTWLLQQLQGMVPAELRPRVKSYRQAYVAGAALGACDRGAFPCDQPSLTLQQDGRSFRVL